MDNVVSTATIGKSAQANQIVRSEKWARSTSRLTSCNVTSNNLQMTSLIWCTVTQNTNCSWRPSLAWTHFQNLARWNQSSDCSVSKRSFNVFLVTDSNWHLFSAFGFSLLSLWNSKVKHLMGLFHKLQQKQTHVACWQKRSKHSRCLELCRGNFGGKQRPKFVQNADQKQWWQLLVDLLLQVADSNPSEQNIVKATKQIGSHSDPFARDLNLSGRSWDPVLEVPLEVQGSEDPCSDAPDDNTDLTQTLWTLWTLSDPFVCRFGPGSWDSLGPIRSSFGPWDLEISTAVCSPKLGSERGPNPQLAGQSSLSHQTACQHQSAFEDVKSSGLPITLVRSRYAGDCNFIDVQVWH